MREELLAKPLWSKSDLASFYGVNLRTVSRWMKRRQLSFERRGRCVRFTPTRVLEEAKRFTIQARGSR